MFQIYIFILALGCTVTTTCGLGILPLNTFSRPIKILCIAEKEIEWLYPNFTVIANTKFNTTARFHAQNLIFKNPHVSDAGRYTCRLKGNNSINATVILRVNVLTILRYNDLFIKCSANALWKHRNANLNTSNSDKYTKSSSGLIIHNVTNKDEGQYVCLTFTPTLLTYTTVNVIWGPEFISQRNQTIVVNISEQMTLNCAVSASPDPVYSWSFPDSCSSCPNTSNDSVLIFTTENITDSGEYTCVAENQYGNLSLIFYVTVIIPPTFMYSDNSVLFEEKFMLFASDVFINCSVNYGTEYNITSWLFDYEPLLINQTSKFTHNTSGLTIYNVTKLDEGNYTCYVDQLQAIIFMHIEWSPVFESEQNQRVTVNVNEGVTLNCTVSASPDPVYSWSFPDSCSSCPNTSNDSVLIFTVEDITDSGEYSCVAENDHGVVSRRFSVHVTSSMNTDPDHDIIIIEKSINFILTCGYPIETSNIKWNIITPLSGNYDMKKDYNINNKDYRLHSNGTIEIYYQFLVEKSYIVVKCSANNQYWSINKTFHLWEHEAFTKEQVLRLYIKNLTNCQEIQVLQAIHGVFTKLMKSLRKWFSSVCSCDGYNNLHFPNLTCINEETGIITSTVHRDGLLSAQELIDLAMADIQSRNPPVVHLSHGWIVCLNMHMNETEVDRSSSSSSISLGLSMLIVVSIASLCTILALLLCITSAVVYIKHRRQGIKANSTNNKKENNSHVYDEIDMYSTKATNSKVLQDEIVFDAATTCVQLQDESLYDIAGTCVRQHNEYTSDSLTSTHTPSSAYQLPDTKPTYDDWKFQCNYEIMHKST